MDNLERNFKGIWISKEIWLCKNLTLMQKVLLVEIDSLDNDNGCYASNQYFADFFELSPKRISVIIQELVQKGYIKSKLIYKENSKQVSNRILTINRPPYPENRDTPPPENREDNNIYNNNIYNNICPSGNEKKLEDFEMIWEIYPRKEAKASAFKNYCTLLKGKKVLGKTVKLTNKEIWLATNNYSESVKGYDSKYIKLGSTFYNTSIFDYLEELDD